jgi:SAM-dependent methyltransferase
MQVYDQDDELIERWQWNDPALRNLSDVVVGLLREERGRVLDLGCGTGRLVADLAARGFEVDGIDVEERVIAIGQRILARRGIRARLFAGDVFDAQLPIAKGGYDVVVCTEVLEHVEAWRELLARAAEFVRPGGTLVVSVPRDPSQFTVLDEYAGHLRRFRDGDLIGALRPEFIQIEARWLGFPTMRTLVGVYTRLTRLLGRSHASTSQTLWSEPSALRRLALRLFYAGLKLDNMFGHMPLGTTIVVRARKRADGREGA